jgi:CheY-like chemotaxis protein
VELVELAKRSGMVSMFEAGLRRVLEGLTSLPELVDNVPTPMTDAPAEQTDVDEVVARLTGRADGAPGGAAAPTQANAPTAVGSSVAGAAASGAGERALPPRPRRHLPTDAPRVLVALDAREERRAVRDALEEAGCAVIEAADGEAALHYARRLRPDLVVTELVLPRLDGMALAQTLMNEVGPPVIAFTVQTDRGVRAWAAECGCTTVIGTHEGIPALAAAVCGALAATAPSLRLAI